ncbi:chemotaxis protein CheB [Geotalea sp. SG265]|uniref:chemotaxis protein CheB n=1 Tax=Geotalea sp. SG265 TaxID=2922867 RepID=UPI001FAFE435|nr:chemotaxis protein CheB [Geotalea sp. SG265]
MFRAVVMGVSTGGMQALKRVLAPLPAVFPLPILIVQHMSPISGNGLATLLDQLCLVRVKEADEEEVINAGHVYIAPANYHLLVESDGSLSLSAEKAVNFARPSVDVLFESAALAFGPSVIGVILTGAGTDGGRGLQFIKAHGGTAIIQDPADAEAASMPGYALSLVVADHVVTLTDLPELLQKLAALGPS